MPIHKGLFLFVSNHLAFGKRLKVYFVLPILLIVCGLVPSLAALADNKIKILSVSAQETGILVKYSGASKAKVKYFTLDGSRPSEKRLVFDYQEAELTSNSVAHSSSLPKVQIKASQFSTSPMVTRVVITGSDEEIAKFSLAASGAGKSTINYLESKKEVAKKTPEDSSKEKELKEKEKEAKENEALTTTKTATEKPEQEPVTEEKKTDSQSDGGLKIEGDLPTEIKISASEGKNIKYKTFRLNSPERLVLDLYDWKSEVQNSIPKESLTSSLIIGVRTGAPSSKAKPVSRLVFDLSQKSLVVEDKLSADKKLLTLSVSVPTADDLKDNLKELRKVRSGLKVVLDAGHGGYDAGAIHSGIQEKDVTLAISKLLEASLASSQIKIVQTRKDDRFVSLEERVNITRNAKPDLFVSIHCNAMQSTDSIKGIESYYFTPQSIDLANTLHKKLVSKTKAPNRYVRKARFVVIRETAIPSVLMEVGFLSNPTEREKLTSSEYQKVVAKALAAGITDYLAAQKASATAARLKSKK